LCINNFEPNTCDDNEKSNPHCVRKKIQMYNENNTLIDHIDYMEEIISTDPDIRLLHNFLQEGEAEHFINNFKDKLAVSGGVADEGKRTYGDFRTSTSAFLTRSPDSVIKKVEERIAKFTNSTIKMMEPLQLLNYKKGQEFKYHYDWFTEAHVVSERGQR